MPASWRFYAKLSGRLRTMFWRILWWSVLRTLPEVQSVVHHFCYCSCPDWPRGIVLQMQVYSACLLCLCVRLCQLAHAIFIVKRQRNSNTWPSVTSLSRNTNAGLRCVPVLRYGLKSLIFCRHSKTIRSLNVRLILQGLANNRSLLRALRTPSAIWHLSNYF
jgi:hypothetical protein